MSYVLIAVYIASAGYRADWNVPVYLGSFKDKESCERAAYAVKTMVNQKGAAFTCFQTAKWIQP